jgi:hypothetical protein
VISIPHYRHSRIQIAIENRRDWGLFSHWERVGLEPLLRQEERRRILQRRIQNLRTEQQLRPEQQLRLEQ